MSSIQHLALNLLTREIWQRNIWIHASYVKSEQNIADKDSRIVSTETEWELVDYAFKLIIKEFG